MKIAKEHLNPRLVVDELNGLGFFSVTNELENGMVKIIAERSF
ncbi:MAG TPA: hypothetical protein VGC97_11920 [Pyrinomonadaceae bacterium]|jgi:hypothetical protein